MANINSLWGGNGQHSQSGGEDQHSESLEGKKWPILTVSGGKKWPTLTLAISLEEKKITKDEKKEEHLVCLLKPNPYNFLLSQSINENRSSCST